MQPICIMSFIYVSDERGAVLVKRILCLIVIMLLCLSGCGKGDAVTVNGEKQVYIEYDYAKNDVNSTEFKVAAENEHLILRINHNTTDIEVVNKKTGYVFKSASDYESGSSGKILELTFLNASGKTEIMNSMEDSVKKGQYKIEERENGAYITYSFGDIVTDVVYPTYISAERFEEYTEKMSRRQQAVVAPLYLHLAEGVYTEEMYKGFLEKYPAAKGKDAYVLRETDLLSNIKKQVSVAFKDAGYTEEDLAKDAKEFGIEAAVGASKNIQFNVGVEYILDGETLKVRCPKEDIFWSEASTGIEKISLLPYFATPNGEDNGYFLLPDGSGSLMPFYNGTEDAGKITNMSVYGDNLSITLNEKIHNYQQVVLPVYATKINNNAVFAIIEQGDAIADINVLSGTDTLAARIWADFNLMDTQLVYAKALSNKNANQVANAAYTMEQAEAYGGDIAVAYRFLSDEKADYNGMAEYYSEYLFGDRNIEKSELPLYLDVVSAIDYSEVSAGFTYDVISTLTTFKQTEKISDDLKEAGINKQKIILSGWQKAGIRGTYVNKSKVSSDAGGKNGLIALGNSLKEKGIELFPDFDVQLTYNSALGNSVNKKLVSRSLVQQLARKNIYNISTFQKGDNEAYAMTPEYTADSIADIPDILSNYGISSASLRYIGKYNIPDYDDDNVRDREEAAQIVEKALKENGDKYSAILTQTGNANVSGFISDITKLPLYSRRYNNTIEVPFVALVYSGHINYSGNSRNLAGTTKKDLLKSIESGAALLYTVAWQRDDNIKTSDFNEMYAICYNDLKEDITLSYGYVKKALDGLYGKRIIKHEILENAVVRVTFEGGQNIVINYNDYAVEVDGKKIEATDYIKGGNS